MSGKILYFLLLFSFFNLTVLGSINNGAYIKAINDGNLTEAHSLIMHIIAREDISDLDKAIAYKHLGTVYFRIGGKYTEAFCQSEQLFISILEKSPFPQKVQEEYCLMLFQRANCNISACEMALCKAKLQGIPIVPFNFIKDYVSPAKEDIKKAREHYPSFLTGDITLLSIELALTEFHIWTSTGQKSIADKTAQAAITLAEQGLSTNMASDAKVKLLLRYATALVEINKESNDSKEKAITLLEIGMQKKSGNAELDAALVSLWAKLVIVSSDMKDKLSKVEKYLMAETESLEQLRTQNVSSMDFMARKAYFSSRTGLYENLMELYAKLNKPFEMLKAINRMRSRSLQDYVNNKKYVHEIETEKQLCQTLKDGAGMLVSYFFATDTVWIIVYTEEGGKIAHTQRGGQEIAYLATQTLNIFSNAHDLQMYFRFGPNYRPVLDAFIASNILHQELFRNIHNLFLERKLSHLYVLPHHILNYFPLGALVVQLNEDNVLLSFFVADTGVPITYLPSLCALVDSGKNSLTENETMILARGTYSYPAFYNNNPANPDDLTAQPLNLPNVSIEGRQVSQMLGTMPQNCYAEQQASEYNLMSQTSIKPKSIVHIASHAHLDRNFPLDSYLVLAASKTEDGKVKVRELLTRYQGTMQVGLLVLSACDTNRGEMNIQPGDDIAALSNAFLVAGVDNVIATQWPASDSSFPKIMAMFYERLGHGYPLDVALSQAQQQFLSANQGAMRYPIFWANIVLNGKNQKNKGQM